MTFVPIFRAIVLAMLVITITAAHAAAQQTYPSRFPTFAKPNSFHYRQTPTVYYPYSGAFPRGQYGSPYWPANFAVPASTSRIRYPATFNGAARPCPGPIKGCVAHVESRDARAVIRIHGQRQPKIGARFNVYHSYPLTGPTITGEIEVIETNSEGLLCRPVGSAELPKLAKGDRVVCIDEGH